MATAQQLVNQILTKIDKFETPLFPMEELEIFVNSGLNELFSSKYAENETSQKRVDDLRTWLVPNEEVTVSAAKRFSLPQRYHRLLGVSCDIVYTKKTKYACLTAKDRVEVKNKTFKKTSVDTLGYASDNIYWKPSVDNCFYNLYGNQVELLCGDAEIQKCYFSYYRRPALISLSEGSLEADLEFPDYLVDELSTLVTRKLVEASSDTRYSTLLQENQLNVK